MIEFWNSLSFIDFLNTTSLQIPTIWENCQNISSRKKKHRTGFVTSENLCNFAAHCHQGGVRAAQLDRGHLSRAVEQVLDRSQWGEDWRSETNMRLRARPRPNHQHTPRLTKRSFLFTLTKKWVLNTSINEQILTDNLSSHTFFPANYPKCHLVKIKERKTTKRTNPWNSK